MTRKEFISMATTTEKKWDVTIESDSLLVS